jgi:hypothetical protein
MGYGRDPVSTQFDTAAAKLLRRAAANRGQWVGTYVKNPSPAWMAWGARNGVNLLGRDDAGGGQARTRWCRGFVRSVYYLHKWHFYAGKGLDLSDRRVSPSQGQALQFQVGTVRIDPRGLVVGRAVRIRLVAGGQAAMRAVEKLPDSKRIYDDDGNPAGRWADPAVRDW